MNENEKTRPCPSCDGVMRRGEREETLTYQGHTLTYMQPGWHCDACDDGILEDSDNEVHDAALHELMARAKNAPITPLAVRVAREAVGLSQREAGRVFGGGPTAFYKYETAKAVPSESMANLLRLAIRQPELFRKPPRDKLALPSPDDAELLRRAPVNDRLNALVRNVYPKNSSGHGGAV